MSLFYEFMNSHRAVPETSVIGVLDIKNYQDMEVDGKIKSL